MGVTISLSNVIKSNYAEHSREKIISIRLFNPQQDNSHPDTSERETGTALYEEHVNRAYEEAENILLAAKQQAEEIRNQIELERQALEEEKRQVFEQAKKEGFEAGIQLGKEQGYREVEEQIQFAKSIVDNAKIEFAQSVDRSEHVILDIGLKTAEKILNSTLSEQPDKFINLVKKAITETMDRKEINILVHPNLYEVVVNKKEEYLSPILRDAQIFVYPDVNLTEGGCVIETDGERIDASIDSQLNELRIKLFEILNGDN